MNVRGRLPLDRVARSLKEPARLGSARLVRATNKMEGAVLGDYGLGEDHELYVWRVDVHVQLVLCIVVCEHVRVRTANLKASRVSSGGAMLSANVRIFRLACCE
jgi:hypothetical protein